MNADIASIRKEYATRTLMEHDAAADPVEQFGKWWKEANEAEVPEVNAMTLATSSNDGMPSARIVLLKGFDEEGFIFFTNYDSYKGTQLAENPRACAVFFWKELERQVRITGLVKKIAAKESDQYFHSRPEGSQVGAITSPQSKVIEDREWLDEAYEKNLQLNKGKEIARPSNWGGYAIEPVIIEFWQGRPSRLHDRLQYVKENNTWRMERLAP